MNGRLILAGGGGSADALPLDELFSRWIGKQARMLYWPIAMPPELNRFAECLRRFKGTFEPLGVTNVTVWTDLSGKTAADFSRFDALYLGGGCTYWLLNEIRRHAFGPISADFSMPAG